MSKDDLMVEEISELQNDPNCISPLVKRCLAGEYEKFVYEALRNKLKELKKWKPSEVKAKQMKKKMKKRNAAIKAKINTEENE